MSRSQRKEKQEEARAGKRGGVERLGRGIGPGGKGWERRVGTLGAMQGGKRTAMPAPTGGRATGEFFNKPLKGIKKAFERPLKEFSKPLKGL